MAVPLAGSGIRLLQALEFRIEQVERTPWVTAQLTEPHGLHIDQEVLYGKCREFQTDSPIISQMKAR